MTTLGATDGLVQHEGTSPHRNGVIMNLERDIKRAERLRKTLSGAIYELECEIAPDKWTVELINAMKRLEEAENLAWAIWFSATLSLANTAE